MPKPGVPQKNKTKNKKKAKNIQKTTILQKGNEKETNNEKMLIGPTNLLVLLNSSKCVWYRNNYLSEENFTDCYWQFQILCSPL